MDWPSLVRKYVWDEERTPYLVRSGHLTDRQIRSELFVYAFLLALLAAVVTGVAIGGQGVLGALGSPVVGAYALTVLFGAIALGATAHPVAAWYCATAPLIVALAAAAGVLRPAMHGTERMVLFALGVLWLGYAARVVRMTRTLAGRG